MAKRSHGLVQAAYLAVLAGLVAVPLIGIFRWFLEALPFPYALDYNEGIVWKQMIDIVAGRGYAPIDGFPAIVYHYPPVYHLTTAALAQTGLDPLVSGRVVSLVATLGSALFVGDFSRSLLPSPRSLVSLVAMVAAMAIFLLFEAVHTWAPQMRVDALAAFFALAGMWCVIQSDRRPALVYLAAILFVLSVFTKQVSIVAPAASFGALLLLRPRRALPAIAITIALGAVVLAALAWQTNGGVLRHLFLYNINRFEMSRLLPNLGGGTSKADRILLVFCVLGYLLFLIHAWRHRRPWSKLDLDAAVMLLFVPLATLSLVATGKYGSSSAYYIQWQAGLAVFGGFGFAIAALVRPAWQQLAPGARVPAAGWAAIPLLLALLVLRLPDQLHPGEVGRLSAMDDRIVELLEPVQGMVISDEMAILLRTGRDVVWEPAIFAELAKTGVWDEQLVIEQFRRHRIGAVVSDGDRGVKWFDERYNPAVAAAMDTALPRKIKAGWRIIHLPAATPTLPRASSTSDIPAADESPPPATP